MKNLIFLLICLMAYPLSMEAQNRVALQHNGQSSFFTSLETAYTAAVDGDTIHLPGGTFAFPNNIMAKRLAVIGAGIVQDSSKVTGVSIIDRVSIINSASESSLTGIVFTTGIVIGTTNENSTVTGLIFSRCYSPSFAFINGDNNQSSRFIIQGCSFIGIGCIGATNFLITNSIVHAVNVSHSEVSNNLFISTSGLVVASGNGTTFKNNIFRVESNLWGGATGAFYNNYNCTLNGVNTRNQGSGNYTGPTISFENLFVNFIQGNYHLTPTAAQTYIGTDNTQIGIYGGRFPWKDGSMPFNPHISTFNVDPQTDNTGRLRLRATINAQRN